MDNMKQVDILLFVMSAVCIVLLTVIALYLTIM